MALWWRRGLMGDAAVAEGDAPVAASEVKRGLGECRPPPRLYLLSSLPSLSRFVATSHFSVLVHGS